MGMLRVALSIVVFSMLAAHVNGKLTKTFTKAEKTLAMKSGTASNINTRLPKSTKIVGGSDAEYGMYRSIVSLRTADNFHYCGGTYIGEGSDGNSLILTAAHCVGSGHHIVIGGIRLDGADGAVYSIAEEIPNPGFFQGNGVKDQDIMLIRLSSKITDIEPAVLPSTETLQLESAGSDVVLAGWGAEFEGDSSAPSILQHVTVPIASIEECKTTYAGIGAYLNAATEFCAGLVEGGVDSCQGDSGGPVYAASYPNLVLGVVSRGNGCARPAYYGIYTLVSAHVEWIQSIINQPIGCSVPNPSWLGDGWCDLSSPYNTAACGWDGGDCCKESCSGLYCGFTYFKCLDPEYTTLSECAVSQPSYIGDGWCDAGPYNTAECNWDGGDCCVETCVGSECGNHLFDCQNPDYSSGSVCTDQPDSIFSCPLVASTGLCGHVYDTESQATLQAVCPDSCGCCDISNECTCNNETMVNKYLGQYGIRTCEQLLAVPYVSCTNQWIGPFVRQLCPCACAAATEPIPQAV